MDAHNNSYPVLVLLTRKLARKVACPKQYSDVLSRFGRCGGGKYARRAN